jgi:two-component system, OmpR family, phosphate regulon sensor histidine kinase PhoR
MKRQTGIFFYILGLYVVLQFAWWGFHLIELTEELKSDSTDVSKRVIMIIGEGLVFFSILLFGLWKIRSSIKKDLQLSERQNNFLLSVTHELKTPLAANKLYLQTIQKRNLDEEKRKNLMEKAIQENERLEGMIENILNASRLENNALKPHREEIDVTALFEQVAERFQKRNQQELIVLNLEKDIIANLDVFFVETIVNNLLDNALKYGGSSGKIELYLVKKAERLVFGVKDQGPGIEKEEIKKMFEKFYRSGNEDTRQQKGSGLGLFIVAELVRMHHGKVSYKENTPRGANFEIQLEL